MEGSLRFNLDPTNQFSEEEIIKKLEKIGVLEALETFSSLTSNEDSSTEQEEESIKVASSNKILPIISERQTLVTKRDSKLADTSKILAI